MRLPLLILPLVCLAGCTSDGDRSTPATAPAAAPAATAPAKTPATATPAPAATTPAAAPAPAAPPVAAKPAPKPVTLDLSRFSGPTENAELFGYDDSNSRIFLYSSGAVVVPLTLAGDGDYEIVVSAACDEADGQLAKFTVALNGQAVGDEITCTTTDAKDYVIKAAGLKAGDHQVTLTFLNDLYKEGEYDLNFYVHGVTLRPAK